MREFKGILNAIGLSLLFWFALLVWLLSSCTTVRNAERRHDRIVANFPSVHKIDTVIIEQEVEVTVPEIKGGDTLYFTTNSVDTIIDTVFVDKIRIIHKIVNNPINGKSTLETYVLKPVETIKKPVKVKCPTIINKPLKWHEKHAERLFILAFVLGAMTGVVLMLKKDSRND